MKDFNDWKKELLLKSLKLDEWYKNSDKAKSFNDWRLKEAVRNLFEQMDPGPGAGLPGPPGVPPMAGPGPGPGPEPGPEPGPGQGGPPPLPPQPNDVAPIGDKPAGDAEDEKAVLDSLKPVLGEKAKENNFPVATAMKLEAKKAKERTIQKKLDSGAGLKMWLWTCVDAWFGTKIALPKPEESPQPQQLQQPQGPDQRVAPPSPGPQPGSMSPPGPSGM